MYEENQMPSAMIKSAIYHARSWQRTTHIQGWRLTLAPSGDLVDLHSWPRTCYSHQRLSCRLARHRRLGALRRLAHSPRGRRALPFFLVEQSSYTPLRDPHAQKNNRTNKHVVTHRRTQRRTFRLGSKAASGLFRTGLRQARCRETTRAHGTRTSAEHTHV